MNRLKTALFAGAMVPAMVAPSFAAGLPRGAVEAAGPVILVQGADCVPGQDPDCVPGADTGEGGAEDVLRERRGQGGENRRQPSDEPTDQIEELPPEELPPEEAPAEERAPEEAPVVEDAAPEEAPAEPEPLPEEAAPEEAPPADVPPEPEPQPLPEEAAPEEAPPADVPPEPEPLPEEAVPEEAPVIEDAVPEEAAPEEAAPEEAVPEEAVPEDAAPEEAAPEEAPVTEEAVPEEAVPEDAAPEEAAPEEAPVTEDAVPEEAAPEEAAPVEEPEAEPGSAEQQLRERRRQDAPPAEGEGETDADAGADAEVEVETQGEVIAPPAGEEGQPLVQEETDETRELRRDRIQRLREQRSQRREERLERIEERLEEAESLQDLRDERRERRVDGQLVIEEPGGRVIIEGPEGNVIIRNNEVDRLSEYARDVQVRELRGGFEETIVIRQNGVRVITLRDPGGVVVRRTRVLPDGREYVLFSNEPNLWDRPEELIVTLPPPPIRIPRERYIVEAERAAPEVIYETFAAPPVVELERRYSLDQVVNSPDLLERVRRVDLDSITFATGSWRVDEGQIGALDAIADSILQIIRRNPDEVFLVEGHTDAVGSELDNLTLSDRRAEEVAYLLAEYYDVPPENLVTKGYGEAQLKVPTEGPSRENRRVTMRRITPLLETAERR